MTTPEQEQQNVESAVAEGGSYELLKQRLVRQGDALLAKTQALNETRIAEFGRSDSRLISRITARTSNNCIARDIVRAGGLLIFGYNVFIGLRKETHVGDVFGLYRLSEKEAADELEPVALEGTFLADTRFTADFRELYAYYKQASLTQLRVHQNKLLAAFRIGQQLHDVRVFRWNIAIDGTITYIDNRGERDIALPPTHDFEWTPTTRDEHVNGKFPHINILDTIFVETTHGDLTIKIENNTESGLGIYSEPVDDKNQALVDAEIAYARLGALILLKVRPYRETDYRYLVFNTRTQHAVRLDAIGKSCVQLPEDHGIVFPGGYYLQSGEHKRFDFDARAVDGLRFKRLLRSPNGEDVLYVFYEPIDGRYGLFSYNLIEKTLATPILSHGYARFDDGRILVFQASDTEPVRNHPMQLWQTPFASEEHASQTQSSQSFFGRIGNATLVRGISELMGIARAVREQTATRTAYEDLIKQCGRVADAYFWLDGEECGHLAQEVQAITATARTTLDEFDKVVAIRREATRALTQAEGEQRQLMTEVASMLWQSPDDFVKALDRMRAQRGKLLSLKEQRYIDTAALDAMDADIAQEQQRIGERAVQFLANPQAFAAYRQVMERVALNIPQAQTSADLKKLLDELDRTAHGLDLLTELLGSLATGDATVRTVILDNVSAIYADVNKLRAEARNRRKALGSQEAAAEFGAQFKLFGQTVENALDFAETPEKCDDALTRLLSQLEELEGRFSEQDDFVADIAAKREAIYEAFAARKQTLLDARQRRVQTLTDAATRILSGIPKRVSQLRTLPDVHAYFASDALLMKLTGLISEVRALGAQVAADDLDTQLKTARDQAVRAIRDRQELVAEDGSTIRLGRHGFTVNRQILDLTLVPRDGVLTFHLTGTDFFAPVNHPALHAMKAYWPLTVVSESPDLYRAEYLAGRIIDAARAGTDGFTWSVLVEACAGFHTDTAPLQERVRQFATARYQEGYQKGIHDHDAAHLLSALTMMESEAGLLVHGPAARALAMLYWCYEINETQQGNMEREARGARDMRDWFKADQSWRRLVERLQKSLHAVIEKYAMSATGEDEGHSLAHDAAKYLVAELASTDDHWVISGTADDLAKALTRQLEQAGRLSGWKDQLTALSPTDRWATVRDWLQGYASVHSPQQQGWVDEAATALALHLPRSRVNAALERTITGLLGEHPRLNGQSLIVNLNDFHARYQHHVRVVAPAFQSLQQMRQQVVTEEKSKLRLSQFQAKPLSSFVRNRLIDEVYLPIVGDNLAKQIGAAGAASRTDRMGLLLLISPPGYGKTTLMEYIADRLGLIFVRVNGPALGHEVTSLDPSQAPHSAARQELEKLNLGLAMGNNVMLYVDDIQHTHPEFLQKFISLCDGTRRIEGIWQGEPRSYDLRGKRFAVVMAGNPYTESGEVFRIPDMLANRADIYNLGDVLAGREALFALSYIENCLTANAALLPLATRDPKDVQLLVRLAQGEEIPSTSFSHTYSAAEMNELTGIFQRLFRARDVLLKVNQAYITSAAQDDAYRTEPPFKLQGSYRNMAKLAGKITSVMQANEMDALLRDHYRGEAQTLTAGAEENLLKLAEIIGTPTTEEASRWDAIKDDYRRLKKMGGTDADGATRVANQLADIAMLLDKLRGQLAGDKGPSSVWREGFERLHNTLASLNAQVHVHVPPNEPVPDTASEAISAAVAQMAKLYETSLAPLINATHHKLKLDHSIWENVREMSQELKQIEKLLEKKPAQASAPTSRKPTRGDQEKS